MELLKVVENSIEKIDQEIQEDNEKKLEKEKVDKLERKWTPINLIKECNFLSLCLFAQYGIENMEEEFRNDFKLYTQHLQSKKGREELKKALLTVINDFTKIDQLDLIFGEGIKQQKERVRDVTKGIHEKYLYVSDEEINQFIFLFKENATHIINYCLGGKKTEDKVKLLHTYLDMLEYEYSLSSTFFKTSPEWFQTILREDKIAKASSSKEEETIIKKELKKRHKQTKLPLFPKNQDYSFEDLYYCYDYFNDDQKIFFAQKIEEILTKEYVATKVIIDTLRHKKERLTKIKDKIHLFIDTWK